MSKQSATRNSVPVMALILLTHIFLFSPFTIYLGNTGEFSSSIWLVLRLFSIPALSLLTILVVIGWLFPPRIKRLYTVIVAILGILVWFQSNVIVWDYGLLDGRSIDWSVAPWKGWVDLSIWCVALIVGTVFYERMAKKLIQTALVLFAIQVAQFGYLVIANKDIVFGTTKISSSTESLNELYKFSSKHNVVHLMLDGFQSDVFSDLIKQVPEFKSTFNGFTFYADTLGAFPYTRFAVPAFFTGKIYHNDVPKDEFIAKAFSGKSILNTAYASGYDIDIAGEEYWIPFYTKGQYTNAYGIPNNIHMSDADFVLDNTATLLDLTLFRIAPHFIKEQIYNNQKWLIAPQLVDKEFLQFPYFSHTALMKQLTEKMTVERESPVYKYIHIMTTHTPMVVTPQCGYAGGVLQNNRPTLTAQSKCTLDTIANLFGKMKSLGIYDDALIIMHADHGGWVPPYKFKRHQASNGMVIEPWMASLSSPLLAIKPPGASGNLVVSDLRASIVDVPDTISAIQGWDVQFGRTSLVSAEVDPHRKRSFYFYTWQRDAWETDYTGPIQEFIIDGSQHEQTWVPGKVFNPPVNLN